MKKNYNLFLDNKEQHHKLNCQELVCELFF